MITLPGDLISPVAGPILRQGAPLTALAYRATASPRWRFLSGMLFSWQDVEDRREGWPRNIERIGPPRLGEDGKMCDEASDAGCNYDALPELGDPETLRAMLALIPDANRTVSPPLTDREPCGTASGWWTVVRADGRVIAGGWSEAEALVSALEIT